MITPDDLLPVINTVNNALSYATSITLNTAPTSDQDGALQGTYNVIAGYIDASLFDLTVVGAVITIQSESVYIRGDLRPSKSIDADAGDYLRVQFAAPASKQIVSGEALFSDSTRIDFMDGQAIVLGSTTILDCRAIVCFHYCIPERVKISNNRLQTHLVQRGATCASQYGTQLGIRRTVRSPLKVDA